MQRDSAGKASVRLTPHALRHFLEQIFVATGCSAANAAIMAEAVTEADLRGHAIQGTDHLYSTIRDLKSGILKGRSEPVVVRESAATALVNGRGVPGHVGGRFATQLVTKKAREAGTAAVGLLNAGDIFMLGYYVSMIAESGLVGMVFTNTWPPRVHPAGGIDRVLGTNPLAIGIPAAGRDPVVLDMATSASAVGHVRIASYYDDPIPAGIAVDKGGTPTTDAHAALDGALSPLGGHKGYGLGLCVGLLSGPVIGAVLGTALELVAGQGDDTVGERGHLFMAVDPAFFGDAGKAAAGVSTYLQEVQSSRKAASVDRIRVPGERAFESRRRNQQEGIPMLDEVWSRAVQIATDLGVPIPAVG